jgi:16S rRNA (cytosine967-C5)-methyltransferase
MAALAEGRYFAHDIDAGRMRDLPARAARAGAKVTILPPGTASGRFDLVLVDAPCSGSGTWRRTPDAKWRLTRDRLNELIGMQREILEQATGLLAPGGVLAYMTCSLLEAENIAQVEWVAQRFSCTLRHAARFLPPDGGDGFFVACLDAPVP